MEDGTALQSKTESQQENGRKTVFVRNLPYTTNDKKLEDTFSEYGPLKRCFVVKDRDKGNLCRGFGYVTFVMQEDATKALAAVIQIDNRKVKLSVAEKKPRQRDNYQRKPHKGDDEESTSVPQEDDEPAEKVLKSKDATGNKETSTRKRENPMGAKEISHQNKDNLDESKRTIIILGLDEKTATKSKLKKLCSQQGKVEKIQYPVEGRNKNEALVIFKSVKTAVKAFQKLNGTTFLENKIRSCLLKKEKKQRFSAAADKSQLILRNLSFQCTEKHLKEAFEKFGEIANVDLPEKVNTKGRRSIRGFAFIQFVSSKDAEKALERLNKSELLGRPMIIDWAVPKDQYEKEQGKEKDSSKAETKDESTGLKSEKKSSKKKHQKEKEVTVEDDDDDDDEDDDEEEDDGGDVDDDSGDSGDEDDNSGNDDDDDDDDDIGDKDSDEEEEDDSDEDVSDSDDEDSESTKEDIARKEREKKERLRIQAKDAKEGRTIFMRNLPFEISEEEVLETFEKFGEIEYCKLVFDPETGHSRGTGFVKYKDISSAEMAVSKSEDGVGDVGISIGGRRLVVMKAVTKGKVTEIEKNKKESRKDPKDKRNLYLANEGVIFPNSEAAKEISEADMKKREKAWADKKTKLKNQNYFISKTRLCFRNLPLSVGEGELKEKLKTFGQSGGKVVRALVMRNKERLDKTGKERSLGFAFVEFNTHEHALAVLRATNNNAEIFGADRRPIVEFAVENQLALNLQKKRLDRQKQKLQKTGDQTGNENEAGDESKDNHGRKNDKRGKEARNGRETKFDNGAAKNDGRNRSEGKGRNKRKRKSEENSEETIGSGKKARALESTQRDERSAKKFSNREKKSKKQGIGQGNGDGGGVENANAQKLSVPSGKAAKFDRKRTQSRPEGEGKSKQDFEVKKPKKKLVKDAEEDKFNMLVNKYKQKLFGIGSAPDKKATGKRWFE